MELDVLGELDALRREGTQHQRERRDDEATGEDAPLSAQGDAAPACGQTPSARYGQTLRSEATGKRDRQDATSNCGLNKVPTRIGPRRRVVGNVGIQVVALRAGRVGLHAIGRKEATQRRVQLTSPEIDEAGAGIGQRTGVTIIG